MELKIGNGRVVSCAEGEGLGLAGERSGGEGEGVVVVAGELAIEGCFAGVAFLKQPFAVPEGQVMDGGGSDARDAGGREVSGGCGGDADLDKPETGGGWLGVVGGLPVSDGLVEKPVFYASLGGSHGEKRQAEEVYEARANHVRENISGIDIAKNCL